MAKKDVKTVKSVEKSPTIASQIVRRQISGAKRDIADWNNAKRIAQSATEPKYYLLQEIFETILEDGRLSSQLNNRNMKTIFADYELQTSDGKTDDSLTAALGAIPVVTDIIRAILDSRYYGYSLIELSSPDGKKTCVNINRRNVAPDFGRFYPDASGASFIPYRELNDYGSWILEFNDKTLGLLNKTVPHVLFKKFAQSCWSELCEIFGIPPRYIKTNTTDRAMLDRAEQMMRELGAAAWFIIDTTEEFQFAQGVNTNGDVYANLINLCNNEICLAISGAIIGQDTKNGNYSKEQASIDILNDLVAADRKLVENEFNETVIPALIRIGWLPQTESRFAFAVAEDDDALWARVKDLLPYKEVDAKWIADRFGIPVSDKQPASPAALSANLSYDDFNPFV
jgi:phage gp29-like protein